MFQFKKFSVEQDRTPMKVGTDGVLLGAWVAVDGSQRRILDIGTGTGLIALMLAQRSDSKCRIDCVEIDSESAAQARENVARSEWGDRVTVYNSDIKSFEAEHKYDLIVSNPPYFVGSLHSPDVARSVARHTIDLSFRDLALSVVRLLNGGGRFALILPVEESKLFDAEALGRLGLVRRCEVLSREGGAAKRIMSEYRLGGEVGCEQIERLAIRGGSPADYTAEYRALTREFYLKF